MSAPDNDTLRAILDGLRQGPVRITADRCSGDGRALNAFCDLVRIAPALAAEVLRLRAERDVLRHERDEHAHKAGEWEESHDIELARAERVEAAARAHLAADDAFSTACRTAAADVPAACARADAARECLAGLVGYVPKEVGR